MNEQNLKKNCDVFSCVDGNFFSTKNMCENLIFHDSARKKFSDFVERGGKFNVTHLSGNKYMTYNTRTNSINIDYKLMNDDLKKRKRVFMGRVISHELDHADRLYEILSDNPNFFNTRSDNNTTVQLKLIGIEVAECFSDIVSCFEAGDKYWNSLKADYPKTSEILQDQLNRFGINAGNKIPNYIHKAIANLAVIGFTQHGYTNTSKPRAHDYHENTLNRFIELKHGNGDNNIDFITHFKDLGFETSFDEDEFRKLLLMPRKFQSTAEENGVFNVIYADNFDKEAIEHKMFSEFDNAKKIQDAINISNSRGNSR